MKNGNGAGQQGGKGVLLQLAELETLPTAELKARWSTLYGNDPPRFNRQFLVKRLAYRIQEIAYGGLPDEVTARLNDLLEAEGYDEIGLKVPGRKPARTDATGHPVSGTVLIREWNGERHEVTALTKGFEYRGLPYRSLSAIARKITGTQWNGPLFFGLRTGPTKSTEDANGQR